MKKFKSVVFIFNLVVFLFLAASYRNPGYAESLKCRMTATSMFVFGKAMVKEQPLKKGDMILAIDPKVVTNEGCVGTFTVEEEGTYGAMAIYGDDPTTPEQDGAKAGDVIQFRIITEGNKSVYEIAETTSWKGSGEVAQFDIIVPQDK